MIKGGWIILLLCFEGINCVMNKLTLINSVKNIAQKKSINFSIDLKSVQKKNLKFNHRK